MGLGHALVGEGDVAHPGAARQGGDDQLLANEAAEADGQFRAVDTEGAGQVGIGDADAVRKLGSATLFPPQPVQDGLLEGRKFQFFVMFVWEMLQRMPPCRVRE